MLIPPLSPDQFSIHFGQLLVGSNAYQHTAQPVMMARQHVPHKCQAKNLTCYFHNLLYSNRTQYKNGNFWPHLANTLCCLGVIAGCSHDFQVSHILPLLGHHPTAISALGHIYTSVLSIVCLLTSIITSMLLTGQRLSSCQHTSGYVRRPCKGHCVCLWLLLHKPKTEGD